MRTAVICLIIGLCGCATTTMPPSKGDEPVTKRAGPDDYEKAKAEFAALKVEWEKEARRVTTSSFLEDRWNGPAGLKIIAMGKRALPFVMEEIRGGNIFFNVAAEEITGRAGGRGLDSEQNRSLDWVDWWEGNRQNPKWNVFLPQSDL